MHAPILGRLLAALFTAYGLSAAAEPSPHPSAWKKWHGIHYRLEADGNFSCYSENGRDCQAGTPATDPDRVRPLVCGSAHRAVWHSTGYDTPDHWCNVAHANLFAVWHDYTLLGHPGMLSKNARGDAMCRSFDGVTCDRHDPTKESPDSAAIAAVEALRPFVSHDRGYTWVRGGSLRADDARVKALMLPDVHAPATGSREIRPVVCGNALRRRHGISGYDQADHWCNTPEIVAQWIHPPYEPMALSWQKTEYGKPYEYEHGRIYKIALPGWTATQQPLWAARIHTVMHHDLAFLGLTRGDEWLALQLPGQNGAAQVHFGNDPRSLEDMPFSGAGWATAAFQVTPDGKASFVRRAGRTTPLTTLPVTTKALDPHAIVGSLPMSWSASAPTAAAFSFEMWVYNSEGEVAPNMTSLDEVVMAKQRVVPKD
ncbi:hypothetical protein CDN99_03045 [Roseateles aquatilis]|uniref:Uncharacterized protein n=1 Tax=Roseateles aquatilis TaxID=431061 RepID=A0A246JLD6_9BURK|nr:hypothetical protein [Roseateles aquatilis]OWQ93464.1 hypothetical protein CDN99_03045 [Roseateles aquatilis]